jgi:RNA polymerase sigma-70 factor, ECF subfamily
MTLDWDRTVKELGPRLLRYFLVTFPRPLAADLVQEVFLRLVRKCEEGRFDPSRGTFSAFAFGIAHFVRLEALKATPPEDPLSEDFELADLCAPETTEARRQAARLRRAIEGLTESQRQVVLLYIDRELTLEEIGEILGFPLGTVKSHLHRAREALEKKMKEAPGVTHE